MVDLEEYGYICNQQITNALNVALLCKKPLLIEGAPGVGKTFLAKALSKALNYKLIRLQMYEGLTADKILYDYDYQKQLLVLEAIRPTLNFDGMSAQEAIKKISNEINFYGPEFIIERPVLQSINGSERSVLLIDEMDKASEENEYVLYEFLEDYSISIPQYGTIQCPEDMQPVVVITANNYRELSGALKRRCVYLYLEPKTEDELYRIILTQAKVEPQIAKNVARCLSIAADEKLRQTPSIAEGIELAKAMQYMDGQDAISLILKNQKDTEIIQGILEGIM